MGPRKHAIGSRSPHIKGQFWGGSGWPRTCPEFIFSKWLSREQNRYGTDASWGVLNWVALVQPGEYDWIVHVQRQCGLITVAHIALAIADDCCILVVLFLFCQRQSFWCPWTDFPFSLPHDMVCSEIDAVLWGRSYLPPKNLIDRNPFFPSLWSRSRLWGPPFHNARESENNSVSLWVGSDVHTKHAGDLNTHGWDHLLHLAWGGARKSSNLYNF